MKFGKLIIRKIVKIIATDVKFDFWRPSVRWTLNTINSQIRIIVS